MRTSHDDQGHRDEGHRDDGHRDDGHRDDGHRDESHRDESHREGGRRTHGHRGGPWGGAPWGGGGGGRRMRRGDIRAVLLSSLLEGPAHGYEVMRRLEERSGGMWRPSAGSVYPTLQMLEEEGLLSSVEDGGKRVYTVTDAGRAEAERRAAGPGPWDDRSSGARSDLIQAIGALQLALRQVEVAGDDATVERVTALVTSTRQQIYTLLAEV